MPNNKSRKRQAKWIRVARRLHRISAILLFVFFFVVAITSVLLGWKKHSDYFMPETQQGTSSDLTQWMPVSQLDSIAASVLKDSLSLNATPQIDRMDVRKDDGVIKFTFKGNFKEVQLDGVTGKALSVGVRRSDFIESIHDASILDDYSNTGNGLIKFLYSTIMGLGLLLFTITGFWLWYGPKKMKRTAKN